MRTTVKGRWGSRAEPGPPSHLTLFNTLITVQEKTAETDTASETFPVRVLTNQIRSRGLRTPIPGFCMTWV